MMGPDSRSNGRGLSLRWARSVSSLLLAFALILTTASCSEWGKMGSVYDEQLADPEGIVVSITFAMGDSAHQKGIQTVINDYKKSHLNVQIQVINNTQEAKGYADDLALLDAMDSFPDLVEMRDTQMFADAGLLAELPVGVQELFEDIPQVNGKVYTAPLQVEMPQGILYDKELFRRLQLREPSTYAEFLSLCGKIKQAGISPLVVGGKDLWHMGFWINHFLMDDVYALDSSWNRKRNSGETNWTDPGPSQALLDLKGLWDKEYVAPGFMNVSDSQTIGYLVSGKAAMLMSGPWMFTQLEQAAPGFEIGFFPVPDRKGVLRITGLPLPAGWAISAQAAADPDKLRTIEQFLQFFYSAEEYPKYLEATSSLPATKGPVRVEQSELMNQIQAIMRNPDVVKLRSMENYWGENAIPAGFRNELYTLVQEFLSGSLSLRQTLERADQAWEARQGED